MSVQTDWLRARIEETLNAYSTAKDDVQSIFAGPLRLDSLDREALLDQAGPTEDGHEGDVGRVSSRRHSNQAVDGRQARGVDQPPAAAQIDLGDGMQVRWFESPGIGADGPRRDVGGPAQADDQVGEVSTDASPVHKGVDRRAGPVADPGPIVQVGGDSIQDRLDLGSALQALELPLHEALQPV